MTYLVNDKCIKCKLMDCVDVCPVDCFYEGKNMLVIKPDECIDCGVCEPECPVDAIVPDTLDNVDKWLELNKKYSEISDIEELMIDAENNEKNSNQILDFTKELKNADQSFKVKVIEILWKIIYSNKEVDMYEANLMSRLSGLLYLDKKIAAEIKEKVKKDF